ncbi:isopenicillin N synthase family dioxygenase [Allorhizocola rhizosphaerae]|uniref:isopenicillin N synthase family dioxygenase n=1 Tax=Allorhizocola rhizosphaerae TaxID=1872709 RepID=UPI000E3B985B|nr:2-oxoglutarate and iron-dependent oxygenase domain-containing protein [Allorhizocola rhizosphaerae]
MSTLPVIDLSRPMHMIAAEIDAACTSSGFFYVRAHGVPTSLIKALEDAARDFFAFPEDVKLGIAMRHAGKAWRGYFPVGAELTSGKPDLKEGLYFGAESDIDRPLHGRNLFPDEAVPEMRSAVLSYMDAVAAVAQRVMRGVAVGLGRDAEYFATGWTADPTILFRIFHYPPQPPSYDGWGVGEHTDYGLLTLLLQDSSGGLQVRTADGWIDAPPIEGTFVCNIGDMLAQLSGGRYHSTPHRVRNTSGRDRYSYPFFFDPSFDAHVPPRPGTYGDYLTAKVARVFPELWRETS